MFKQTLLLAAVLAAVPAAHAASSELVTNGSFESTALANGSWALVNGLSGWTIAGGDGLLELRNNVAGSAQSGVVYAELDGNHNVTISQSLATKVGQAYTLSFWYSSRINVAIDSLGLQWTVGNVTGSVDTTGPFNGTSNNVWQNFTTTFIAQSALTNLSFAALGKDDTLGTSLDNVSVKSAIPEPATLALLAGGLAAIGVAKRRRNI
ncbi:DUF642 domain-containing protein [Aquabacterium sp.]|uniref:DUF642 domain-containing protein n=1 Tax=Aquabacterium sp. TaxID=1872578 RepID=UPI0035B0AE2C